MTITEFLSKKHFNLPITRDSSMPYINFIERELKDYAGVIKKVIYK